MAIILKITKSDQSASVSIVADITESQKPVDFKNKAMTSVPQMEQQVGASSPFLTYRAIESACISGAIYARRKLGVSGTLVDLISYSYSGKLENAEPFAVAIMIAACKSMSGPVTFSENELDGWREAIA